MKKIVDQTKAAVDVEQRKIDAASREMERAESDLTLELKKGVGKTAGVTSRAGAAAAKPANARQVRRGGSRRRPFGQSAPGFAHSGGPGSPPVVSS